MASLPCFGILKTTDTSIQFIIVTQIIHLWFSAFKWGKEEVSVKFSSVIHLTVDDYYLRGFGLISISV